ncbi:hypothetical protein JHK85_005804 [Glycine max]|nr:hypothetical protein JHK85_005804 [Glycine max]KAG5081582.1 hypothetical protein JHK86_005647 [Glycine max]KAH1062534.1 hypothetical protein GYH30_005478 [Glycine max]
MHCAIALRFRHRKRRWFSDVAHGGDEDEVPTKTEVAWDAARNGGCSVVRRYLAFSFCEGFQTGSCLA